MGNISERRRAFTLIELLVVIAISALFSTLAITYSSVGRNEVALTVEVSEISQSIVQAKALAIATYTSDSSSCGYGVTINGATSPQTYSIFSYSPTGVSPCPSASDITSINPSYEQPYTEGTWQVPLAHGVKVGTEGSITVLFYPPDPAVFLSSDGTTIEPATISIPLVTTDGENADTILVNPEGQVSF